MKPINITLVLGVIFALAFMVFGIFQYTDVFYAQPVTDRDVVVEIMPGETFAQVSSRLHKRNLLPASWYWRLYAKFSDKERSIRAGEYQLTTDDTMASMLEKFISGDAILYKFTIIAGWNLRQIMAAMQEADGIEVDISDMAEISRRLNIRQSLPEGWFYPDTYFYHKGTTALQLLAQAHEKMQEILSAAWKRRHSELSLQSPYQALVLASIVEKESLMETEQPRIAGVFFSRLDKNMRLQADPTVIYGIGEAFDGNLRQHDLNTDTPYNTYIHKGLPPTPIAMPGEKAIAAVMNPDVTGDLYFVAKGDGSHHFSKNYSQHQRAVRKYQLKRN